MLLSWPHVLVPQFLDGVINCSIFLVTHITSLAALDKDPVCVDSQLIYCHISRSLASVLSSGHENFVYNVVIPHLQQTSEVMIQYCLIRLFLTCSVVIYCHAHLEAHESVQNHAISASHEISAVNDGTPEMQLMNSSRGFDLHDEMDGRDTEPSSLGRESDAMFWHRSDIEESVARVRYNVLNEGAVGDGITNDTQVCETLIRIKLTCASVWFLK